MGVEVELRCERFTAPPEEYIRCVAQATAGAVLEYVEGSVVNVVVVAPSETRAETKPAMPEDRAAAERATLTAKHELSLSQQAAAEVKCRGWAHGSLL